MPDNGGGGGHGDDDDDAPPPLTIDNVVVTFRLNCQFESLARLARLAPFFSYDGSRFAAAIAHMDDPLCTILLFSSGQGVCAGTKLRVQALLAVQRLCIMLRKCGVCDARMCMLTCQNLVTSTRCPWGIDLQKCKQTMCANALHNPALFPGLRYHPHGGAHNEAVLLYASGSAVVTGAQSKAAAVKVWKDAHAIVKRHKTAYQTLSRNPDGVGAEDLQATLSASATASAVKRVARHIQADEAVDSMTARAAEKWGVRLSDLDHDALQGGMEMCDDDEERAEFLEAHMKYVRCADESLHRDIADRDNKRKLGGMNPFMCDMEITQRCHKKSRQNVLRRLGTSSAAPLDTYAPC